MSIKVDKTIVRNAVHCNKNHCCLNGGLKNCCEVENNVKNVLYYVNPTNERMCIYKMLYGTGYICTCPVRNAIFDKYKF